jgi:prepilin-type N-terminal cleavage/methylation domain-containing protein
MIAPRARRAGYTLIEILFALALGVLLLGGLYVAVDTQMRLAQTGRTMVERTSLVRATFQRLSADVAAATTLCDAGRYRRPIQAAAAAAAGASGSTGMGTGTTTAPAATTPAATTPATGTTTPASGTGTTANAGTTTDSSSAATPIVLPLGVIGDSQSLNLIMSRVPKETWRVPATNGGSNGNTNIGIRPEDGTELVSDLRKVTYWLNSDGDKVGLARYEGKIITTDDVINLTLPDDSNQGRYVVIPEARSVQFEYFDGANWSDSWDSTQVGADGYTPMGPPRAIRITLQVDFTNGPAGNTDPNSNNTKTFAYVVAINTANGTPLIEPAPTDPSTSGSGSNSQ